MFFTVRLARGLMGVLAAAVVAGLFATPVWAATATVSITDMAFVPATLKVNVGDTINFKNATSSTQSAKTSSTLGFDTGNIGAGQTKSVVVSTAGTYSYSSAFNTALTGSVEVMSATATASSSPTPTASGSATKGQPTETQPQPVSGVMDALLGVLALGAGALLFGLGWQQRLGGVQEIVPLKPVTLHDPESSNHE